MTQRLRRWAFKLRSRGPVWIARAAIERVRPGRLSQTADTRDRLRGATALEVGGPSHVFGASGVLPIYDVLARLDLIDYAERTVWTDTGETARESAGVPGHFIVGEASRLPVRDESYDLVLSSHVLEHLADPLAGLAESMRVVRPGGRLIVVLPDGSKTFDRRRNVTSLEHLYADRGQGEDDITHRAEILESYDFERSELVLQMTELRDLVNRNLETRFAHHHVFNRSLGREVLEAAGYRVEWSAAAWPHHLVFLAVAPD